MFPPLTRLPGHASRTQTGVQSLGTCSFEIATVAVLGVPEADIPLLPTLSKRQWSFTLKHLSFLMTVSRQESLRSSPADYGCP